MWFWWALAVKIIPLMEEPTSQDMHGKDIVHRDDNSPANPGGSVRTICATTRAWRIMVPGSQSSQWPLPLSGSPAWRH